MEKSALLCLSITALFAGVVAQAPAPSPSSDCITYIAMLSPCLNFVMTPTNQTKPDKDCCTGLSSVVSAKASCLCMLLNANNTLGLPINMTQALALPGACNVKTPPVSRCSTAAAANSPSASSPATAP
ncbi:hypothetical protein KI387_007702, partial [Taxus chinensis]